MKILETEINNVRENEYKLAFKIPTQDELKNIRLINRDRTAEEKCEISKSRQDIKRIIKLFKSGTINQETMPELKSLIEIVKRNESSEDDWDE